MSSKKQIFDLGKAPHLHIVTCQGSLDVRGTGELDTLLIGKEATAVPREDGGLDIECNGNLRIRIPQKGSVTVSDTKGSLLVRYIDGDVAIGTVYSGTILKGLQTVSVQDVKGSFVAKNINGPLNIESVYGDVSMRNLESLTLSKLHGDLAVRNVVGDVHVQALHGDVSMRNVGGDVTIDFSARDVNLRNVGGILAIQDTQGDIRLWDSLASGKHTLKAAGDIVIRWPVNAPLLLEVQAAEVKNYLPLKDLKQTEPGYLAGRIGDGETVLACHSQGSVILKPARSTVHIEFEKGGAGTVGDYEFDFSDEFASEMEDFGEQMSSFGIEMAGLGEEIARSVQEKLTDLTSRLETKINVDYADKVAQKTERAIEKYMRKAEKARQRSAMASPPTPPAPPAPPASKTPGAPPAPDATSGPADSSQAQLKVLQMLENGTISVEEANQLLKALE